MNERIIRYSFNLSIVAKVLFRLNFWVSSPESPWLVSLCECPRTGQMGGCEYVEFGLHLGRRRAAIGEVCTAKIEGAGELLCTRRKLRVLGHRGAQHLENNGVQVSENLAGHTVRI